MPDEKDFSAPVIDLAARRLERLPHVRIDADYAANQVVQTAHHPKLGNVEIGYPLEEIPKLIEALISEAAKLGSRRWLEWAAQMASFRWSAAGSVGRARAFCSMWRATRPNPRMDPPPSRELVAGRAAALAQKISGQLPPLAGATPSFSPPIEEAGVFVAALTFGGEPLHEVDGEDEAPRLLLPWDTI